MADFRFSLPVSDVEIINVRVNGGITEIENESNTGGVSDVYLPTNFIHVISSKLRGVLNDGREKTVDVKDRRELYKEFKRLSRMLDFLTGYVQNPIDGVERVWDAKVKCQDDFEALINDLDSLKLSVHQHFNYIQDSLTETGKMYYLIDLERTIASGVTHYWKSYSMGYTTDLTEAGLYSESSSLKEVESDFNKRTVRIAKEEAEEIASR